MEANPRQYFRYIWDNQTLTVIKKILTLLLLILFTNAWSQNLASWRSTWENEDLADTIRLNAMERLLWDGYMYSRPDSVLLLGGEMLRLAERSDSRKYIAIAENSLGHAWSILGEYTKAMEFYSSSLNRYRQMGYQPGIGQNLMQIGDIHKHQGKYDIAEGNYLKSQHIFKEIGDGHGMAISLKNLGDISKEHNAFLEAMARYDSCLSMSRSLKFDLGLALGLNAIGTVHWLLSDNGKALDHFQKALSVFRRIGHRYGEANVLNNIGSIYSANGSFSKAQEYYNESLHILQGMGSNRLVATNRYNLALTYAEQGRYARALESYWKSLSLYQAMGDAKGVAVNYNNIGNCYSEMGQLDSAVYYTEKGLALGNELGDEQIVATCLVSMGLYLNLSGNHQAAIEKCSKGREVAKRVDAIYRQQAACECLYEANKALKHHEEALKYHEEMIVLESEIQAGQTAKSLQQMEFRNAMLQDSLAHAEEARKVELAHREEVLRKNRTRNGLLLGGLFALILALGLYSRARSIRRSRDLIQKEKDRSDSLLLNILPEEIAEELKIKGSADAKDIDMVTMLFTDFKGFTQASAKMTAKEVVDALHTCFKAFDEICGKYGIEKIKTIGDAYMAAGGLSGPNKNTVEHTVLAALEMQEFITQNKASMENAHIHAFEMRVGVHTGPVVAGIVGVKKFQYDVWGDTVNTASRMESNGAVGKVNITQYTYELLKDNPRFTFDYRGKIEAKGKGAIDMYFVALQPK